MNKYEKLIEHIINDEKYKSFGNTTELEQLCAVNKSLSITDVQIKNPNNPVNLINAKLITFKIE